MFSFLAEANIHDTIISVSNLVSYLVAVGAGGTGYHYFKKLRKNNKQEKHPVNEISSSIVKNRIIQSALRSYRESLNADRALVFLYHNGELFASGNHLLKVSCAFESLANGVTSVSPNYLSIPYVIFQRWDVGTKDNPAIFHESNKNDEREDPLLVQMLMEGGIGSKYTLPIFTDMGGNLGFISFHYLRETVLGNNKIEEMKKIPAKVARILQSSNIEENHGVQH